MHLRRMFLLAAVALVATGAHAQLIVGTDDSATPTIFHINITNSDATPLYVGSEAIAWGMAYDHDTNTLYWNNGGTLFSSPFSMAGLTPTNLGTMTFNGANTNFVGLGYRNGKLLGTRNIATEAVYEIDPGTLVATQLYVYPSAFDFGGVDVDLTTTLLYCLNDATNAQGRGLYEVDVNAQTETFRAPYPAGETDIDGLACYNGLAYYVIDQPGVFYIYDIGTGAQVGTLDSPWTGSEVFSAAAYVPDTPVSIQETSWGDIKSRFR